MYLVLYAKFRRKYALKKQNLNDLMLKMKLARKEELAYFKLKRSDCKNLIFKISLLDGRLLFCENVIYDNLKFLYSVSDFIDKKINDCKFKFRGVYNCAFIEYLAGYITHCFSNNHKFKIINFIKLIDQKIHFQKKELYILKTLLSKNLIEMVFESEYNLFEIREVILNSKNAKYFKRHRKTTLKTAQYYSICKFNKDLSRKLQSKKLLTTNASDIKFFIRRLYIYEALLKKSILYLKLFFE